MTLLIESHLSPLDAAPISRFDGDQDVAAIGDRGVCLPLNRTLSPRDLRS
jgi:hypothetical protein